MPQPPALQLADLSGAGRDLALPADILLPGAGSVQFLSLLRTLPGRRYVGQAIWRTATGETQTVLAKLLVGDKAARHFEREQSGARLLAEQNIPTPALLTADYAHGQGGWLLFEFLEDAESLGDCWQKHENRPENPRAMQRILTDALRLMAKLHAQGLWQEDLHLDNLLYQQEKLYLVDGGGIRAEIPGKQLSAPQALNNLGVFFAQLSPRLEDNLEEWLTVYLKAAGSQPSFLPTQLPHLHKTIAQNRNVRIKDLMKKIGRDCSLFSAKKMGWRGAFGVRVVRRDEQEALDALLQNPDAHIAAGHIYKDGGAATVARVDLAGRSVVVKRYNIKNFRHWLTRFWRRSRAWTSWREGNRLMALDIATAKPLAILERRCFWLTGVAYLVMEYLPGEDLAARFAGKADEPDSIAPEELAAVGTLFTDLVRERISHSDLKGQNLIWCSERKEQPAKDSDTAGHWALIDLDALRVHRCEATFRRAHRRDRKRFLKDWQGSGLEKVIGEWVA
ncbi:hypothetical protein AGMMS50289_16760 [Betaproteobacteria bacterium]|nr:hypothetical protein AGMMS50289_16760 [Betaproteobacteria bacterium]